MHKLDVNGDLLPSHALARCGTRRLRRSDEVYCVTFSLESDVIATGGADGKVVLWSVATGKPTTVIEHPGPIRGMAFSKAGRLLTSCEDGLLRSIDPASGEQVSLLEVASPQCLDISSGLIALGCAGSDGPHLLVIDELTNDIKWSHVVEEGVSALKFSPDAKHLATGGSDGTIRFWDTTSGSQSVQYDAHDGEVMSLAFSPIKPMILSGGTDGVVKAWSLEQQELIANKECDYVFCVRFSPDGKSVASSHVQGVITIRSALNWNIVGQLVGHGKDVREVAYSPDGRLLASVGYDGCVILWDAVALVDRSPVFGHRGSICAIKLRVDGDALLTSADDPFVCEWNSVTGELIRKLKGASGDVFSVGYESHLDSHKYRVREGWFETQAIRLKDVHPKPDDSHVVFETILMWQGYREQIHQMLADSEKVVHSISRSRSNEYTAIASRVYRWVTIRNELTGDQVQVDMKSSVLCTAFSRDSLLLAAGCEDGTVAVWRLPALLQVIEWKCDSAVYSLAFSMDGSGLAMGCSDNSIRLWSMESARERMALLGHDGLVLALEYFAEGQRLISGSRDMTALVWDVSKYS